MAARPDTPRSKKEFKRYPDKFNLYYQDNFGFRENLLTAYNNIKYAIGDSPSEKVTLGKNGWLFYKGPDSRDFINIFRGIRRFNESDLKQFATVLEARQNWLASQGIKYLFVIAPNKHSIYREHYPDHLYQVSNKTITDDFINYMQEHTNVRVVDLRQTLIDNKEPDTLLYFRTGTHWNNFGSNIAQFEIAKELASLFPGKIDPILHDKSVFKTTKRHGRALANMIGFREKYAEIYPTPLLASCSKRQRPRDGNIKRTFTTVCDNSDINAVIFRDSFFEWLVVYISQYFNRSTYVWKELSYSELERLIQIENPDIVIEEWVERSLPRVPALEPEFLDTDIIHKP